MAEGLDHSYVAADTSCPVLEMTCGDALRNAAAEAPDRIALAEGPLLTADSDARKWTYRQLLADAEDCAHWLLERYKPGEHICLWSPNRGEWVILQYGAALAGLVLVTANPALREPELRHVLDQSDTVALFYTAEHRGTDMAAIANAVADTVREVVDLDGLLDTVRSTDRTRELPPVSPQSAAQIQFTSGTTGRPKGAMLKHNSLVTNAVLLAARTGQSEGVVVSSMPLFHTAGSVLGVLGAAANRSTLIILPIFDAEQMLATVSSQRATSTSGVPTMLSAMLQVIGSKPFDLSSLRVVTSGGAPVPCELHRQFETVVGCPLVSLYGQTELSPAVTATGPEDAAADRAFTSGRPLPQTALRIVDTSDGTVLPVGEVGEVQVRGYQTMLGYYGDAEATARTLLPDGWLRTGDLGQLDQRGYLTITGRLSEMIIRGGENIYPAEIEAAMLSHPAIAEIAVIGLPDPHWGEIVAAIIRSSADIGDLTVDSLRAHCRQSLAPHKTPSRWFHVDAYPLTASGKVQKNVLIENACSAAYQELH